jgi:curli biogenesis system outer membrane secretion channel CsgG
MRKSSSHFWNSFTVVVCFVLLCAGSANALGADGKNLRKSIAVVDFSSRISNFEGGAGMVEMLTNALFESDRFVVLDRDALWQVLDEQDFAASDRSANALQTAVKGKVLPAQLLIIGAITEWAPGSTDSSGGGVSLAGIRFKKSKATARMGVVIRILDSSTAEVLESVSVEGEAEYSASDTGVCFGGACAGGSNMSTQGWAEVTEDVIKKAVKEIVSRTRDIAYRGKLIRIDGETIYTNTGERNGVENGDIFSVFSPGEELVDPDTGESLGSDMYKVGSIRLISVQEKFSRAIVETGSGFQEGHIIMPATGRSDWN